MTRRSRHAICVRCERLRQHEGRGLCDSCWSVVSRAGQLARYPLRTAAPAKALNTAKGRSRREELLEEVPFLISTGSSYSEVAKRMGLTLPSLARRFAEYRKAGLTTTRIPYREAIQDDRATRPLR